MDHVGPTAGGVTYDPFDGRPRKTNIFVPVEEVRMDYYQLGYSGISVPTGIEIRPFQRFVSIIPAAHAVGSAPLTSFEIEDVVASKRERARGESKKFSSVDELFADLDS
jgi:hypothetical protein